MKLSDNPRDALRQIAGYLHSFKGTAALGWTAAEALRVASIPCDHETEIADLKRQLAEAIVARDNAERMQAIWGAKTVWGSGYEAACRAAEMRLPVYPARDDYPPTPTAFLESVGIRSPKGT